MPGVWQNWAAGTWSARATSQRHRRRLKPKLDFSEAKWRSPLTCRTPTLFLLPGHLLACPYAKRKFCQVPDTGHAPLLAPGTTGLATLPDLRKIHKGKLKPSCNTLKCLPPEKNKKLDNQKHQHGCN